MSNKKDLEELEKWNMQRIIEEKEKSKFYFENFDKNKKIDKLSKILKTTGMIVRILAHIIIFIAIIIGIQLLAARISNKL